MMSKKSVTPSVSETAFDCPHCGAYTTQMWASVYAQSLPDNARTPFFPGPEILEKIERQENITDERRKSLTDWVKRVSSGQIHLHARENSEYLRTEVENLHISKCYNCKKVAVWVHDRMVSPQQRDADVPNPDMPEDIVRDFEEARGVVVESPRGAAALLRLCIQKLCIHLGEKGNKIDEDIASLVSKGLNPIVQKSLDVVRVIGNEAVHPGTIDLRDDRDTALKLFKLVNLIVEQMISFPNAIDELYEKLPESKRKGIERRDRKPR